MKNIITIVYTTIISILILSVFFTIAELTIVAKTEFSNQLQQTVVMNASYLISCKLILQILITSVLGNMLYHKIGYNIISKKVDEVLKDNKPNSGQSTEHHHTKDVSKGNPLWINCPDRMQQWRDRIHSQPLTPTEPFKSSITKEDYEKAVGLQFDPIDQIDELDKNCITEDISNHFNIVRKGYDESKGIKLKNLLKMDGIKSYTFRLDQIEDNKRWIELKPDDNERWLADEMMEAEHIIVEDKTKYYKLVR